MNCEELRRKLATADGPPRLSDASELEHLRDCEDCRGMWLTAGLLAECRGGSAVSGDDCPPASTMVGLADGSLVDEQRDLALRHAASCAPCTRSLASWLTDLDRVGTVTELAGVPPLLEQQALRMGPALSARRRPAIPGGLATLAAAAGIAFAAIGLGLLLSERVGPAGPSDGPSTLRGGETAAVQPLEPQGEVGPSAGLRFAWRDDRGGEPSRYRLVVTDLTRFDTPLDVTVTGTTFALAPEQASRLRPGREYHWIVEPLDGGARSPSPAVRFRIRP